MPTIEEVDWAEYNAAMEARMEELFEEWQEMIDKAFTPFPTKQHPPRETIDSNKSVVDSK